jgi:hypothetical protein
MEANSAWQLRLTIMRQYDNLSHNN